ncbi:MAG: winged helix DNA-binding domain-containing protein [Ardenticatenaceae bacterium]|nr:winged helix DNA-binding domain-containing protein [Ardenticatenaceae bacterium]
MTDLTINHLHTYRDRTFRRRPDLRLRTKGDAIEFVNARGFIYFWPIKDITLPSLWTAVAGDRPVASEHDDPGHITWGWKDDLLDKRQWYYARVLRGRATLIALDVAPYFYALSENYGDPEEEYLQLYEDGLLTQAAKMIFEALLREGPLDTVSLRRLIRMTSKASNSPFERGLTELQRDFKILPVGVAQTGAWRYSFIYDLVHRYYRDLPEKARPITRETARLKLTVLYFDSLGAATAKEVQRLFHWSPRAVDATLAALVQAGQLRAGCQLDGSAPDYFVVGTF